MCRREKPLDPQVRIERREDTAELRLAGSWRIASRRPRAADVADTLRDPGISRIGFDAADLEDWDSSLLIFLEDIDAVVDAARITVDRSGLPEGVRRLVDLSDAVPRKEPEPVAPPPPVVDRVGLGALERWGRVGEAVDFLGETTLAFGRLIRHGAPFRRADLMQLTQQAGADALGIVALVSFLLGLILAFVGAQQLRQFGATIFVADLVGVAMARDMAALMTAIVMAGRSGGAYAAQLGIMKTNQEIDALSTMGIRPVDYLVLPRIIALCTMMPFLVLFSLFLGIAGGAFAGTALMNLSFAEYWNQTASAVSVGQIAGGLVKGFVYAALVAFAGCYQGLRAERSSMGVGAAATSAVVTGIVAIIAACGVFQVLFDVLGF